MEICFISDTHDLQDRIEIPPADILVHAGDLTMAGKQDECYRALQWLNAQPHEHVVIIAGNHDFAFESTLSKSYLLEPFPRLVYLENSAAEVAGLKFWGSPVQPWFMDWAFNVQRGAAIKKYWDEIPEGLDVLITHGPPFSILDQAVLGRSDHLGCGDLLYRLMDAKPKIHVFGHIHGSYGRRDATYTTYLNASMVNEAYQVVNAPHVLTYEP